MEVAAKSKAKVLCGFCRRGTEAESVCGPLYTSEICNAHKKCMQYSALLVQYRQKTFGGFKKHKVHDEIKRGRVLSCSLCKNRKKSKQKIPHTGASCGCAIGNCRKTYHFYCASQDPGTLCRRIEVRSKETGKKSVQYRVFCSEEHLKKYELAEKGSEFTYNDVSSDSGSESEEEVSSPDKSGKRKSMNSSGKDKKGGSTGKKRAEPEPELSDSDVEEGDDTKDESDINEEAENEVAEPDSGTKETVPTRRLFSVEPPKKRKVEDPVSSNTVETQDKVLAVADSSMRLGEITFKEECNLPDGSQVQKSPSNSNPLADVYLCIMEGPHLKDKVGDRIRQIIAKQYNTPESSITFWSSQGQNMITAEHMIYFLKDVAQYIYESDTKSLARIITNPTMSDVEKYSHNVRFNEDYMDPDLIDCVQSKIRDVIGNYFVQKREDSKTDHGSAYFLGELNTMFVVLPITDLLDPAQQIRQHIREPCDIFSIGLNTELQDRLSTKGSEHKANSEKEADVLISWLKRHTDASVKVKIRPKEIILRQKSMNSTTCHVCTQLQMRSRQGSAAHSSVIMFVVPVNEQIMAYGPYCQAVISAFVEEDLTALSPIFCVLDVDNLEGISSPASITASLPDNLGVEAFCGLDPKVSPISCLILKIFIKA